MGYPSLYENILERIADGLMSLIRDEEIGNRGRSTAEEEARLEAIKRAQVQIQRVLDEHLDIFTTPGLELVEKIESLETQIAPLIEAVARAERQLIHEQVRTREALQQVTQREAEITSLKKENDRLEMKVAYLNVKDNGGRGGPVRSRRT